MGLLSMVVVADVYDTALVTAFILITVMVVVGIVALLKRTMNTQR